MCGWDNEFSVGYICEIASRYSNGDLWQTAGNRALHIRVGWEGTWKSDLKAHQYVGLTDMTQKHNDA